MMGEVLNGGATVEPKMNHISFERFDYKGGK